MRTELITISSFQTLPPVNNFFEIFINLGETFVFQNTINNFDNFLLKATKHITIKEYKSSQNFNNQNIFNKILKYFTVFKYIIIQSIKSKIKRTERNIYTIDLFTLYISIIFKQKKDKIIYHQFETIEPNHLNKIDKIIYKLLQKKIQKIDLIIIPEINRSVYFQKIFPYCDVSQIMVIPNTNNNIIPKYAKNKNKKFRITHVGSVGIDYHIKPLLDAFCSLPYKKFELLFVGILNKEVKKIINNYELPNVKIIDQVKHYELDEIYKNTDVGIILYKDVGLNYKFCAPNKLYEYWSFGIPVIGDNLPGLTSLIFESEMCKLVDMKNSHEISSAIEFLTSMPNNNIINFFKSKYSFDNYSNEFKTKLKFI